MLAKEERIALRDKLINKLKSLSILVLTKKRNNDESLRFSSDKTFIRELNNNNELRILYNQYISEFRSEDEAKYCLSHQDDFENHRCSICNELCTFYNKSKGYKITCGKNECKQKLAHSDEANEKFRKTMDIKRQETLKSKPISQQKASQKVKQIKSNIIKNVKKSTKQISSPKLIKISPYQVTDLQKVFKEFLENNGFIECKDKNDMNGDFLTRNDNLNNNSEEEITILDELDFLFKKYKIAFDINDIKNNNSKQKGKRYFIDKIIKCRDNQESIRLIHIWEWELRKEILWNRLSNWILNLLNNNKIKLFARKCKIKLVPLNEEKDFLNQYHLQGYKRSEICLGLYYNDELVELMSFCKSRWNKNYEWELLRLCTKFGYIVGSGSDRLLKNFIRTYNVKSIISYCNLDKFDGEVYARLGFKLLKRNSPSITWYEEKTTKMFSERSLVTLGADKLIGTKLGKGTDNVEIMENSSYQSMYNCGQNVYVMNIKN